MTDGFGFELERDKDGKFIINEDTPEKHSDKFYRQKGDSIYFDLDSSGDTCKGLMVCLEAAKQEKCTVNYNTNTAGLVPVTPEMSRTDAINTFMCHKLLKTKPEDGKAKKIKQLKAKENAPESIGFEDFYFLDSFRESGTERIVSFCNANDINIEGLKIHYDLAVEYAKQQGGSYEEQARKGTEHFGLPEVITQENLPELREKLVLSRDDPRVAETQKRVQQSSRGRSIQKE